MALEIGRAIREVVAIDWHDKEGYWLDYIRVRVKMDTTKPRRRIVRMIGANNKEVTCAIKI